MSLDGNLNCFHYFVIANCAAINILAHVSLGPLQEFPQAIFPESFLLGLEILGHSSGLPPEPLLDFQDLVLSAFLTFASMIAVKGDIVLTPFLYYWGWTLSMCLLVICIFCPFISSAYCGFFPLSLEFNCWSIMCIANIFSMYLLI